MRTSLIILASVCVLGFTAAIANAKGPKGASNNPAAFGAKIVTVAHHHHGGHHPGFHGRYYRPHRYHPGIYRYRPYRYPVVVPYPAYRVYRRPYYCYPRSGFYYSTPGFAIGFGF